MSRRVKLVGKKSSRKSMRDKYWKQVFAYTEVKDWDGLSAYINRYPWLATAAMGPGILPDYLLGEKDYGLLRLLCNVEDVPVEVVRKLIALGARDKSGRGYLERLLAGSGGGDSADNTELSGADSPLIAAEVLRTCSNPAEVIERMQQVLEQGVDDDDSGRKALAARCIGRSQLFYDLLMLLYEYEMQHKLRDCLGSEELMMKAWKEGIENIGELEAILTAVGDGRKAAGEN